MMKKTMILAVPAMAVALFVAANVRAEEAAAPAKEAAAPAVKEMAVKGVVAVTKEGDKVTAVSLKAGEVVLKVAAGEVADKLAALDGKEVGAMGVKSADGKEITVKTFKVVEAKVEEKK
jgi:hypothetical protein